MVWEAIIESIGAQIRNEERAHLLDEIAEITQAETASVSFSDRIRGARGRYITVAVDEHYLSGMVIESGADWLILSAQAQQHLISLPAIDSVVGLSHALAQTTRYVPTMNSVLRRLIGENVQINRVREMSTGQLVEVGMDYIVLSSSAVTQWSMAYETAEHFSAGQTERYIPLARVKMVSSAL
ncbi:hypothetical protein [Arcanobacterium pinnipediorum]|uniref:Uncharacterized protein n=1 Tax=Arcanobacterium pinnipediorum TaxID=1503041 RepID=A0ABY5AK78_9ACTO|nr:hypothetical protein [Arcanobacterium pinnipediorum]USR79664.1 hypothetical protein NG665_01340 [Arcanobacterium pinnipediorum]